jgi:hypothetical protein
MRVSTGRAWRAEPYAGGTSRGETFRGQGAENLGAADIVHRPVAQPAQQHGRGTAPTAVDQVRLLGGRLAALEAGSAHQLSSD